MAIDASKLTIDLEERERWRRHMSVTVPADLVEKERKKAAAEIASNLDLPGFRKGKVPRRVVEQRYGDSLRRQMLDRLINDAFREALQLESLQPISEGQLEDVQYEREEDLTFAISFDVQPEIELSRLGGFAVERPDTEVEEDDVDEVLQHLREQNAVWHPREGEPEADDLVQVRIEQLDEEDDEPREYEFVLGRDEAIPDVENAIRTLEVGEGGEFSIGFPEDFPNEELRGQERRLRITLLGRKIRELPELDDELARTVGDFDSVDALEAAVREDLQREAEQRAEQEVRGRLLDMILEANSFEVPESMVEGYVDQVMEDADEMPEEEAAQNRAALRPQAERAVKRALIIDRVAETQALRATEDEIDGRVEEIAERNDTTPAKIYARLQKDDRLSAIERQITEEKVFDFLKEKSTITDES